MQKSLQERFEEKYVPEPNTGCWLWFGSNNGNGYGTFSVEHGIVRKAHRVSYELTKGPIPSGLHIDHLCRVRCCVNPDHLEAVSKKENDRRSLPYRKDMKVAFCRKGHSMVGENLYFPPGRLTRQCVACQRERNRLYMRKRRGQS